MQKLEVNREVAFGDISTEVSCITKKKKKNGSCCLEGGRREET